ncbi:hypothetical protein LJB42_004634 [Komagataella kurtzmanii]|nr:hypothetical protein LJB42_004634 [Komagataella kurtzmanii]
MGYQGFVGLDVVIPHLKDNSIEADLMEILPILADENAVNEASKADLTHVTSRAANYLRSNQSELRWFGTKLVHVLCLHPRIIASDAGNYISALTKIIESKCYITSTIDVRQITCLESAISTLDFIMDKIRHKVALTREILTPRLPSIIQSLVSVMNLCPKPANFVLHKLFMNNTTTLRPFTTKIQKELRILLDDDEGLHKMDNELQSLVVSNFVTIQYALERTNTEEIYKQKLLHLLIEMKEVFEIYSEFLDLNEDSNLQKLLAALPSLPHNEEEIGNYKPLFPSLDIDSLEPLDILQISRRLHLLISLLKAFISNPRGTAVKLPLGYVISFLELNLSLDLRFSPMKREFRDVSLKKTVEYSIIKNKTCALELLTQLPSIFGGNLLPHFSSLLSVYELSVPVEIRKNGHITIIEERVWSQLGFIHQILLAASELLSLTYNVVNITPLLKLVDVALLITKSRLPKLDQSNSNGGSFLKRKKKGGQVIPLSDMLSHQHLFTITASKRTLAVVRQFFATVLKSCLLPSSKQSEILRFVIIDTVKHRNEVKMDKNLQELIHNSILFPGHDRNSILPIISSIISDKFLSVFMNPRFPISPRRDTTENGITGTNRVTISYIDDGEDEDSEEELDNDDSLSKRQKTSDIATDVIDSNGVDTVESMSKNEEPDTGLTDITLVEQEPVKISSWKREETRVEVSVSRVDKEATDQISNEYDSDSNSEFEIPVIVANDSEDDDE